MRTLLPEEGCSILNGPASQGRVPQGEGAELTDGSDRLRKLSDFPIFGEASALLRQVVYEGLRKDKPAADVRRAVPYPETPPTQAPGFPSKAIPAQLTGNARP
jgi:hypothetical protein